MRDNYDDPRPWTGFDLDGTLALAGETFNANSIGRPIKPMLDLILDMIAHEERVKIFTARVSVTDQRSPYSGMVANKGFVAIQHKIISAWNRRNIGMDIEVTCVKDALCKAIYDDIAWRVERNVGIIFGKTRYIDETFHPAVGRINHEEGNQ